MTFSPLISGTLPHHGKYSSRSGVRIKRAITHHWAGVGVSGRDHLSNPNVGVSANYVIMDGKIYGQVPEEYRAWTTGSWDVDAPSITWEVQNSSGAPNWDVSQANINCIITLLADLAKRYGWGGVAASNHRGHREFSATACPGPSLWPQLGSITATANTAFHSGKVPPTPSKPSTPLPGGKSVAQLATEVLAGVYGNGADRRAALGSQYDAVQAEVNRRLNGGSVAPTQTASITQLAQAVLRGEYGNGEARVKALGSQYNAVQAEVNRLLGQQTPARTNVSTDVDRLARAVLRGDYGNGEARVKALGANYAAVQNRVNEILAGGAGTAPTRSVDQIAREVIRGDWGNGADRKAKLERAGYNYQTVQNRVNQLL